MKCTWCRTLLALVIPLAAVCLAAGDAPESNKTEEVTIYRDEFGVPNIFADTAEGAVYGMGYAQAEDRLEEILKQYRRAEGTMAEVFGSAFVRDDYRQRLWQHRAIAEANYGKLDAKGRGLIEAYQAGLKQYMKEHPEEVPGWAPELHPWQIIALGRYVIWGWPEGDAGSDLLRAGIHPDPVSPRSSNEWVVTASRTTDGAPLAVIDPHLSWYGPFRFYEARLYGGELQMAGVAIPGLPITSLGHNRFCSVAMTTGGPDAADVYEEELNPSNPRQYKYDGQWREMSIRHEVILVKDGNTTRELPFDIASTHHGPVVAHKDGKAYAMKLPYFDQFRLLEQSYRMATAHNLAEMKAALAMLQLMEQNIMIATVEGDVYYVRNGRVPIRPKGFDWSRPVPGNTSGSEWLGIHPLQDLVQIANPWQGYMQNCNTSPEYMMYFSPLTPARYADKIYLYNADERLHPRAAMVRELLRSRPRLTLQEAFDVVLSPQVYHADHWQKRLIDAWQSAQIGLHDEQLAHFCDLIVRWNGRADADSKGALPYRYWKEELGDAARRADHDGQEPPKNLSANAILTALRSGMAKMLRERGRLDVAFGEVYRVGRQGSSRTWPVSGGSLAGLTTPRAISFDARDGGKTFVGRSGQTSTQLVLLTRPPRSWTLLPLGESDHPNSKHWDDQAEKLFSPGKLKPTYFMNKQELLKHLESKTVLHRPLP
jgi:acyl-homoserine-lactone acylase